MEYDATNVSGSDDESCYGTAACSVHVMLRKVCVSWMSPLKLIEWDVAYYSFLYRVRIIEACYWWYKNNGVEGYRSSYIRFSMVSLGRKFALDALYERQPTR